jgi:hypothetical protein
MNSSKGVNAPPVGYRKPVLQDDIRGDVSDDAGEQLLGRHAARSHPQDSQPDVGMKPLEFLIGRLQPLGVLAVRHPPYDEIALFLGGRQSGEREQQEEGNRESAKPASRELDQANPLYAANGPLSLGAGQLRGRRARKSA